MNTQRLALPTRVITYAWGERYVDELLSYAIPALLAPGNLPYVAAEVPCELVILSEKRLFETITNHQSIKQAQTFCRVRLISLDDLVASPDSYGMALTFALHRGFADLGPAMTNSWQIFLNADFILAQNSLKSLLDRLVQGERLVASPSYCVNSAAAIPELKKLMDAESGTLAIPSRKLAELALKFRHNTVIGKTSQSEQLPSSLCRPILFGDQSQHAHWPPDAGCDRWHAPGKICCRAELLLGSRLDEGILSNCYTLCPRRL